MARTNPFEASTFRGVNMDLLKGVKRGGYRAGTIGVSDFQGKVLNYQRRGFDPLKAGAGVSTMTARPTVKTVLKPSSYDLYAKSPESALYSNFYRQRK